MQKILNTAGLGVSGRQNELIELALTFKFDNVEVDMNDLIGRHDTMGKEFACQFLKSANIDIGTFVLPINLDASDEEFNAACAKLDTILSLCETLHGKRCRVPIATSSETEFQPNFERHRARLYDLGEKCAPHGMDLGLMLQSPGQNEKSNKFIRTAEEIMTLVKTVGHDNVGLFLDTWQWQASGGGMDQISDIDVNKITELAMADLPDTADPANIKPNDRVMPGENEKSFSVAAFNHLKSAGYDGAISFATHLSTFAHVNRDRIINLISKRLERLQTGQPLDAPIEDFRGSSDSSATESKSEAKTDAAESDAKAANGESAEAPEADESAKETTAKDKVAAAE
jgi:sugar phosphate isomerase/epimerase